MKMLTEFQRSSMKAELMKGLEPYWQSGIATALAAGLRYHLTSKYLPSPTHPTAITAGMLSLMRHDAAKYLHDWATSERHRWSPYFAQISVDINFNEDTGVLMIEFNDTFRLLLQGSAPISIFTSVSRSDEEIYELWSNFKGKTATVLSTQPPQ